MNELKEELRRAAKSAERGRELVAKQKALVRQLEESGRGKSVAEDVLCTMLETQQLHEEHVSRLEWLLGLQVEEYDQRGGLKGPATPRRRNQGNRILASLPYEDLLLIQEFLEHTELSFRTRIQEADRKLQSVYFLDSGLAVVVAVTRRGRHQTPIGFIGSDGMTGFGILFGSDESDFDIQIEVEGEAQRLSLRDLKFVLKLSPTIKAALVNYSHQVWLQLALTAAVNAHGSIEQRLACFLLTAQKCLDCDVLPLTHEQLSFLLSVRRAGVTIALNDLEKEGLIQKRRCTIEVIDRPRLEQKTHRFAPILSHRCFV